MSLPVCLRPVRLRRRLPIAVAALALASCRLIDQTTFAPAPEAPAPAAPPLAVPVETRLPLVTVQPGTDLSRYRRVFADAVGAARDRDPLVRFDVVSVVPAKGTLAEQVAAVDALRPEAISVMHALVAAGAGAARIRLAARPDPAAPRPEIRVYVR